MLEYIKGDKFIIKNFTIQSDTYAVPVELKIINWVDDFIKIKILNMKKKPFWVDKESVESQLKIENKVSN